MARDGWQVCIRDVLAESPPALPDCGLVQMKFTKTPFSLDICLIPELQGTWEFIFNGYFGSRLVLRLGNQLVRVPQLGGTARPRTWAPHSEPGIHLVTSDYFVQAAWSTNAAPLCSGHASHGHEVDPSPVLSSWAHRQSSVQ